MKDSTNFADEQSIRTNIGLITFNILIDSAFYNYTTQLPRLFCYIYYIENYQLSFNEVFDVVLARLKSHERPQKREVTF